jgi:hypothetical protein
VLTLVVRFSLHEVSVRGWTPEYATGQKFERLIFEDKL